MANLNKVQLIGRLTRDPELKYTQSGKAVVQFTLAVDKPKKDGKDNGANFIRVIAWEKLGELAVKYLSKGRLAYVEGRIEVRQYDDKETGKKITATDVVADNIQFLDSSGVNGSGGNAGANAASSSAPASAPPSEPAFDINEDDLPF